MEGGPEKDRSLQMKMKSKVKRGKPEGLAAPRLSFSRDEEPNMLYPSA